MTETSTSENTSTLQLFHIDDGGEVWWYAEPTADAAIATHIRMNYTEAGEPLPHDPFTATVVDPSTMLVMNADEATPIERPAREWVDLRGPGLVATTCF